MTSTISRMACAAVMLVFGCGEEPEVCTEIGCTDMLTVELRPTADDEFESGIYGVEIAFDGAEERCEFEVRVACQEGGRCVLNETCDAEHSPEVVSFVRAATPSGVEYSVTRDGLVVASGMLEPEYVTVRPNGQGCPPACEQAVEVVEVR